jgi:hypothetical protein
LKFLFGLIGILFIIASAGAQTPKLDPDGLIRDAVLAEALAARESRAGAFSNESAMVIVDYGLRSDVARLFILDLETGRVEAFRTAHGLGSDPNHDGWLDSFSSVRGSNASPRGAFITAEAYYGKHGRSLRLDGIDEDNANARARAIVMHAAWYAEEEFLDAHGKLGRSNGCIVFSERDRDMVFETLKPGTFLWVTK